MEKSDSQITPHNIYSHLSLHSCSVAMKQPQLQKPPRDTASPEETQGLEKHICIEIPLLSIILIKIPLKTQIPTTSAETATFSKMFHLLCTCCSLFANQGLLSTFILQFPSKYTVNVSKCCRVSLQCKDGKS